MVYDTDLENKISNFTTDWGFAKRKFFGAS